MNQEFFNKLFDYFDVSKGRDNEMSKIANKKVNKVKDRELVYNLVNGDRSTKEISIILGKEIYRISGRFTELKASDKIELSHYKDGFSVYKLKK
jgi:hypothetical protein